MKINKNKIACDVDGVLANIMKNLRECILKECNYDIMNIDNYDFYKSIPNLSLDMWHNMVDSLLSCQDCIPPYEDAVKYFKSIYSDDMILITARRSEFSDETRKWMMKNYGVCPEIVNKSSSNKLEYLINNGFNILIEDRLRTANQVSEYMNVFLLNRSWNFGRDVNKNVVRVNSFEEISKILCN